MPSVSRGIDLPLRSEIMEEESLELLLKACRREHRGGVKWWEESNSSAGTGLGSLCV